MMPEPLRRAQWIWRRPPSSRRERLYAGAFLTSYGFLTMHPYRALKEAASGANEGWGSVAIGTAAAIVRANLPEPADARSVGGRFPFHEDCSNADYTCVCPGRGRWRYQQHVDVVAAVRADLRDHVFPDPAAAAEEGERPRRAGEEYSPWRHGGDLGWAGRQGDKGGRRRPDRI